MKRWCYSCGEENETGVRICSGCGTSFPGCGTPGFSRRAVVPEAPRPIQMAGDFEPEMESYDGLMKVASIAMAVGVAVIILVAMFFVVVVAMAALR